MSALLDLEPSATLVFRGVSNGQSRATLTLRNSYQNQHVFFKIKTTAPKRYSVKPNSGHVEPGASQTVEIAMPERIDASQIAKDKFLVETVIGDANARPEDLFTPANKAQIGQTKLKCQQADGDTVAPLGAGPSARQAPVHAPYSGRLSSLAPVQTIGSTATSVEEESELARVMKINKQLKEQNAKLEEELAGMGDGLRQRRASSSARPPVRDFAAPGYKPQKQSPLPAIIVALLVGWFIGHFLQFP